MAKGFPSCLDFFLIIEYINAKALFIIFQIILCEESKENRYSWPPHMLEIYLQLSGKFALLELWTL